MLLQRETGPFTLPVGYARLSQAKYESFDVSVEESEPVNSVGEKASAGCVFV